MKTETSFNRLEIITCRMALKMAAESKGKMHLTNPALVRRSATRLLTAAGWDGINSRTKWELLHKAFEQSFGVPLDDEAAAEKAATLEKN